MNCQPHRLAQLRLNLDESDVSLYGHSESSVTHFPLEPERTLRPRLQVMVCVGGGSQLPTHGRVVVVVVVGGEGGASLGD